MFVRINKNNIVNTDMVLSIEGSSLFEDSLNFNFFNDTPSGHCSVNNKDTLLNNFVNIDKNFIRIKNLVVRISAIKSISTFVSTNKNYDFVMTITCFNGKEDIQYSVELGNMEDAELIYCVLMEQIGAKDISENIKWEE